MTLDSIRYSCNVLKKSATGTTTTTSIATNTTTTTTTTTTSTTTTGLINENVMSGLGVNGYRNAEWCAFIVINQPVSRSMCQSVAPIDQ